MAYIIPASFWLPRMHICVTAGPELCCWRRAALAAGGKIQGSYLGKLGYHDSSHQ